MLALAAGIAVALLLAPQPTERSAADGAQSVVQRPAVPKPLPVAAMPALPDPAAPAQSELPPGVDARQWAALRAEFADRPAELRRLADHLTFADEIDRFRSGRADGRSAGQLALARSIDAGLDERLSARELSAAEARLIKIAVLDVLVEDEGERRDSLERWEAALASPAPDPKRSAALADFQRRQATLVAAWRALPPGQRDPRALERDLQALRVSSFDNPQPGNEGAQR